MIKKYRISFDDFAIREFVFKKKFKMYNIFLVEEENGYNLDKLINICRYNSSVIKTINEYKQILRENKINILLNE